MRRFLPLKAVSGSRGSVFQTGLPFWARIRGFKNPRLLRDRPTDGAARAAKICVGMGRIVYAGAVAVRGGLCGFKSALYASYCGSSVDYGRSKIMRKTTPHRVVKRYGRSFTVAHALLKTPIF